MISSPEKTSSSGHPLLLAHLRRDRVAHAYLFSGPPSPQKDNLVLDFTKALNCEKGNFFQRCDCTSCRKIGRKTHPDIHRIGDPEERSVKISDVRKLLDAASLRPYEGKRSIFIIPEAEKLTTEASNALLKILEEPSGLTVFLLLAESKGNLLETIQSRSLEIRVAPAFVPGPSDHPWIDTLKKRGVDVFLEKLRSAERSELGGVLEILTQYLKDRSIEEWGKGAGRSKQYLDLAVQVCEVRSALDSNVNQKLAVTYLEIHWRRIFNE